MIRQKIDLGSDKVFHFDVLGTLIAYYDYLLVLFQYKNITIYLSTIALVDNLLSQQ